MSLQNEIIHHLKAQGADFVRFVDISHLPAEQNRNYHHAILFGIALTPTYLRKVTDTPDFVENLVRNKQMDQDEFHLKEIQTDRMADDLAIFLEKNGYAACSQSEAHLEEIGSYDVKTKTTPLPHKTIAGLAGLGWIGKHNLLVTEKYGSAISMCTVLTDAPVKSILDVPVPSQCGDCKVCQDICEVHAIKGKHWNQEIPRDDRLDVFTCTTCLKCLVHCPWTQRYVINNLSFIQFLSRKFSSRLDIS